MVQSNGTTGPAAAAAPSVSTPGNPPPQPAGSPPAGERGGSPPPGPSRTPPPPPEGGAADAGAGAGQGKPSAVSEWVNRLFGRPPSQDGAPTPDRDPEQPEVGDRADPEGAAEGEPGQPALSPAAADLARQLAALSPGELTLLSTQDGPFRRAVQSEIDRRTARANRVRDEQGRFVRQQRIDGLKQAARDARRTDVYKAAEIEEQIDGLQQQEAFVRGVVENYDRVSIDPIMLALPEPDRAALMADLPEGLEGRKALVNAALGRLKEIWQAEARGQRPGQNGAARPANGAPRRPARPEEDEGEEPEVSIAGRGRRRAPTMNDWLRGQMSR